MTTTDRPVRTGPQDGSVHYFSCSVYDVPPVACDCGGYVPTADDLRIERLNAALANVGVNVDAPEHGSSTGSGPGHGSTWNPATDKQRAFLSSLGVEAPAILSKRDASAMIDDALASKPKAPAATSALAAAPAAAPARSNRYAANCNLCGGNVPAETGSLRKDGARWIVEHVGGCPAKVETAPPAAGSYEPAKGDVHVVDGAFYRVHISQSTGRAYTVKARIDRAATWNDDGSLDEAGIVEWEYPGIGLRSLSTETLATADEAAAFGHLAGRCCFCSTPIDTPESTTVGYGPKCASDRGLPWGANVAKAAKAAAKV